MKNEFYETIYHVKIKLINNLFDIGGKIKI